MNRFYTNLISRNKLYIILSIACIAGYLWVFYQLSANHRSERDIGTVCLFKHTTGVPCPSCGSTRSVISLVKGNISQAIYLNPFGIIIALIMLITPFWIFTDVLTRKKTLWDVYRKIEIYLKNPVVIFSLVLMVLINWIWNITKGL